MHLDTKTLSNSWGSTLGGHSHCHQVFH